MRAGKVEDACPQAGERVGVSQRVEPISVDGCFILDQAKEAWSGIAGLASGML